MIEALAMTIDVETLARVFGRSHPILVHFPIALLIVAAAVESWRIVCRRDRPSTTALTCCALGVLGAIAAGVSGWINADVETHSARLAETMAWHRWVAIAAAGIAGVAWILGVIARNAAQVLPRRWWFFLLVLGAGGVGFAGHLGGSMVWGDGYIFAPLMKAPATAADGQEPAPPVIRRLAPAGTTLVVNYSTQVLPILRAKCFECHDASKRKGDLRLDDLSEVFAGDEAYWSIRPGQPDDSELIYRVKLGTESEDRMPPEGSPLSPEEIAVLSRWIAEGAWEGMEGETPDPPQAGTGPGAEGPQPSSAAALAGPAWSAGERDAVAALRALGARVEPVTAGETGLDVNLSLAGPAINDTALNSLVTLGPRVRVLDVAGTSVTDGVLAQAFAATNQLERLNASRTAAGDVSGAALGRLEKLVSANFFGTPLTDAGAASLAASRSLRHLCITGTQVTDEAAAKLAAKIERVEQSPPPAGPKK